MKITSVSLQARDKNRVNVSVDGKYRFSLDVFQVGNLGIKVGNEYEESDIIRLETESQYGKVYSRALEYCLMRPHSVKEVRDYLYRKTRPRMNKTGEITPGVDKSITDRVLEKLVDKKYVNDFEFAKFWVENRSLRKGISSRKLESELRAKGVDVSIVSELLQDSSRSDSGELQKIIIKKRQKYTDDNKLMAYLARQGFSYEDIKSALSVDED